jgi:hypothetical protein
VTDGDPELLHGLVEVSRLELTGSRLEGLARDLLGTVAFGRCELQVVPDGADRWRILKAVVTSLKNSCARAFSAGSVRSGMALAGQAR